MKRVAIGYTILAMVLAACESSATTTIVTDAPSTTAATAPVVPGPTPVIVDYSPTVSDVGGLMYLLAHPDVEVVAVTLPATGEAGCELGVEVTLGILAMYGREDIPVACDPDLPTSARSWPADFLAGHENLRFGLPETTAAPSALSAPDLIAAAAVAADRPVVVYAVGPLTNVARALGRHPDLAGHLDRVVIMGGAVDVPGNVFEGNAEWNLWIDVSSAAEVVSSGVPITLVPLDATGDVPVPGFYQRLLDEAEPSDPIVYVQKLVRLFPQVNSGFWYFWDELAAAVAAGESVVDTEEIAITVARGDDDGRTMRDDAGHPVQVATGVPDPRAFYGDFLSTLAGSPVEAGRDATAEEKDYFLAVEAALANLEEVFESVFNDPALEAALSGDAYDATAFAEALDVLLSGVTLSYRSASEIDPPQSLRQIHDNLITVLGTLAERKAEIVAAAAAADSFADFEAIVADVPFIDEGCGPIAEEALYLGVEIELFC